MNTKFNKFFYGFMTVFFIVFFVLFAVLDSFMGKDGRILAILLGFGYAIWMIIGELGLSIQKYKGYVCGEKSLIAAFLLGGFYLIYAAGLPIDPEIRKEEAQYQAKLIAKYIVKAINKGADEGENE